MKIFNWEGAENESGVSKHRIKYALERRRIGGIAKVRGAYVFSTEDVERIKSYFAGRGPWQRATEETDTNTNEESDQNQ